jgi:hypothetical protein
MRRTGAFWVFQRGGVALAVADLNGDGNLNLVVTNGPTLGVLLGSGTGSFSLPRDDLLGASAWSVVVGDFNGDGKPNLAAADWSLGGPGSVFLLLNNGAPS